MLQCCAPKCLLSHVFLFFLLCSWFYASTYFGLGDKIPLRFSTQYVRVVGSQLEREGDCKKGWQWQPFNDATSNNDVNLTIPMMTRIMPTRRTMRRTIGKGWWWWVTARYPQVSIRGIWNSHVEPVSLTLAKLACAFWHTLGTHHKNRCHTHTLSCAHHDEMSQCSSHYFVHQLDSKTYP